VRPGVGGVHEICDPHTPTAIRLDDLKSCP
jgi:hypothetical protein